MQSSEYLIIGLGKTGHSIARYLQRQGASFMLFDTRLASPAAAEFEAEFPDVAIYLGEFPPEKLSSLAAIIVSPGVPLDTPCIEKAKSLSIPVYGDIECLAREITVPVIGITGTNGKSTVTTLVGLMAQNAGLKTAVAGNIGTPVLDLLADETSYDVWVLELSSFQLDLTDSLKLKAATILNVTPDHLDRHHSMEAYVAAKQRIYHKSDYVVYNREDSVTAAKNAYDKAQVTSFGLNEPNEGQWGIGHDGSEDFLMYGDTQIIACSKLLIKGRHNWANALAACALAQTLGISFECMKHVLTTFAGLAHRSQWVRTLNQVDWINDSKGTNIGATQSAVAGIGDAIRGKIVLIAGGQGKGADFRGLREVVSSYVQTLILFGQDADKLEAALHDVTTVSRVASLEDAVAVAHRVASPGDVVLLSPACASLDMFHDFNHRGEVFTTLVGGL